MSSNTRPEVDLSRIVKIGAVEDPVLADDAMLMGFASLMNTHRAVLIAGFEAAMCQITLDQSTRTHVAEIMEDRRAVCALEQCYERFERYATEAEKREAARKNKATQPI